MTYNYLMTTKVKQAAADQLKNRMLWAVGFIHPAETQDDRTEKYSIIAYFENPWAAEEFISNLQVENKERFFITRTEV